MSQRDRSPGNPHRRRFWGWAQAGRSANTASNGEVNAVDNNNEINSNYMDSMENDAQNMDSYSFDELTGSFSLDDEEYREQFGDAVDNVNDQSEDDIFVEHEHLIDSPAENENTFDAPDAFTESAQNEYNNEVERVMQVQNFFERV